MFGAEMLSPAPDQLITLANILGPAARTAPSEQAVTDADEAAREVAGGTCCALDAVHRLWLAGGSMPDDLQQIAWALTANSVAMLRYCLDAAARVLLPHRPWACPASVA